MTYSEIKNFYRDNVEYGEWVFHVGRKGEAIFLQVRFMAPDNYHPEVTEIQYCRKFQLSTFMTPTELVQTAWLAVQRALLHEASENFKYKGADIFNTHMNIEKLLEIRGQPHALEHRPPPNQLVTVG